METQEKCVAMIDDFIKGNRMKKLLNELDDATNEAARQSFINVSFLSD